MRKGMFLRLALTNIKKNRGTFVPYILSSMGCIAVLYIMLFIVHNPDTRNIRGGSDVAMIVSMGVFVLGIFSVIFLLFCNSFLMKRRQKEIGLYNVLGMEKRHISRMLLVEMVITGAVSFAGGIGTGILGSKLALLFLLKVLHLPAQFGFYVAWEGVKIWDFLWSYSCSYLAAESQQSPSQPSGGAAFRKKCRRAGAKNKTSNGSAGIYMSWNRLLYGDNDKIGYGRAGDFSAGSASCYGGNLSGIYSRKYYDTEADAPEKKLLL